MKFSIIGALLIAGFFNSSFALAEKPSPDPTPEEILETLDCAGTVVNREPARLKPTTDSSPRGGHKIQVDTANPSFPQVLNVLSYSESPTDYFFSGVTHDEGYSFSFTIEKIGVHHAYNARLDIPLYLATSSIFECYFKRGSGSK